VASFYSNEGKPEQALRAWLSEHDALPPFDVRYKTFATIEYALPSYHGWAGLPNIILDFWATWCGYCKLGYPEIRELRAAFKPAEFEAVGVTSFQGRFADERVRISGSDLSKEREIELTRKFAAAYEMDWPLVFLKSSVYDAAYTVNGLPLLVIIDKAGRVRQILSGHGHAGQVRRWIDRLLAE
jgi:thiol-disulfide isomerase/thioredoxin